MFMIRAMTKGGQKMVTWFQESISHTVPLKHFDYSDLENFQHLSEKEIMSLIKEASNRSQWDSLLDLGIFIDRIKHTLDEDAFYRIEDAIRHAADRLHFDGFDLFSLVNDAVDYFI